MTHQSNSSPHILRGYASRGGVAAKILRANLSESHRLSAHQAALPQQNQTLKTYVNTNAQTDELMKMKLQFFYP
jgi:hypothetical protein